MCTILCTHSIAQASQLTGWEGRGRGGGAWPEVTQLACGGPGLVISPLVTCVSLFGTCFVQDLAWNYSWMLLVTDNFVCFSYWNFLSGYTIYQSAQTVITKYLRLSGLNNRNFFSQHSGGWKSAIKRLAGWFLLRLLSLVCKWPASSCVYVWALIQ